MIGRRISNVLGALAACLAVLTVGAAWAIQTFWPYYAWGSGDFYAWVGRVLWGSVLLGLLALVFGWKYSPLKENVLRAVLLLAIAGLGSRLEFTFTTHAEGRYYFSQDWVTKNAENWQSVLAPLAGRPELRALEIGSYEGRSAIWFLENILTDPSSSITCIDVFIGATYERNFDHNLKPFATKLTKIKAPSHIALRGLKLESYDFAYVDGSHYAQDVLVDAVLTWDLIKPGGIIIFDDYGEEYTGSRKEHNYPKIAVDAFLKVMEPNLEVLFKGYQVAIRKK
jgi:hypothetical protein